MSKILATILVCTAYLINITKNSKTTSLPTLQIALHVHADFVKHVLGEPVQLRVQSARLLLLNINNYTLLAEQLHFINKHNFAITLYNNYTIDGITRFYTSDAHTNLLEIYFNLDHTSVV